MLSKENAEKLRELLGIEGYMEAFPCRCLNCCGGDYGPECTRKNDDDEMVHADGYFSCAVYEFDNLPTLSQLLEEVEKRGWQGWELWKTGAGDYGFTLREGTWQQGTWFAGYTPEDAVALALIEILEGEK